MGETNTFKKYRRNNQTPPENPGTPTNNIPTQSGALGHWRLDEALATDSAVDQTGNYLLVPQTAGTPAVVATPFGNARTWVNNTGHSLRTGLISGPEVFAQANWWFMAWLSLSANQAAGSGAIITYEGGSNNLEAENSQINLGITGTSLGFAVDRNKIYLQWENGLGVRVSSLSAGTVPTNSAWTFIAVAKEFVGAAGPFPYAVRFYLNGLINSVSYVSLNATGGGTNSRLALGKVGGLGARQFTGIFDEPQWVAGTVSDSTILAIYNASTGFP